MYIRCPYDTQVQFSRYIPGPCSYLLHHHQSAPVHLNVAGQAGWLHISMKVGDPYRHIVYHCLEHDVLKTGVFQYEDTNLRLGKMKM